MMSLSFFLFSVATASLAGNGAGEDGPASRERGPLIVEPDGIPGPHVVFWLETSLQRVFPNSPAGRITALPLLTARNRHASFQACLRNNRPHPLHAACSVEGGEGLEVQVRRVGYVPMPHHTTDVDPSELDGVGHIPGLVPDPLFPENTATVGPWENQAFWITIFTPADASPGPRDLTVRFSFHDGTQQAELHATVDVRPLVVQPRRDFPVTHWWRAESIYEIYGAGHFDERCWELVRAYLKNLIAHGTNVIFVPAWFPRREVVRRPAQLLEITTPEPDRYAFDWSQVSRFIRLADECGAEYFEWPHLWIYWGVKHPMPIYTRQRGAAELLWPADSPGFGDVYVGYLKQFLPELHAFLLEEGILERSFFHLSDEPSGEEHFANYRRARELLRELAPWMKVMDALSEVGYGKEGLTDIPIPIINAAQAYIDAWIPHWVYFCCGPRGPYLNRFYDTPLAKLRMAGWLFYRLGAKGFLHWGYNCWQRMEQDAMIDPWVEGASGAWPDIPYGDPFVVYPGPEGPIDSIRWEVFAESLEDYALLQTAGVDREDSLLAPIQGYADFPKTTEWIENSLREILTR